MGGQNSTKARKGQKKGWAGGLHYLTGRNESTNSGEKRLPGGESCYVREGMGTVKLKMSNFRGLGWGPSH